MPNTKPSNSAEAASARFRCQCVPAIKHQESARGRAATTRLQLFMKQRHNNSMRASPAAPTLQSLESQYVVELLPVLVSRWFCICLFVLGGASSCVSECPPGTVKKDAACIRGDATGSATRSEEEGGAAVGSNSDGPASEGMFSRAGRPTGEAGAVGPMNPPSRPAEVPAAGGAPREAAGSASGLPSDGGRQPSQAGANATPSSSGAPAPAGSMNAPAKDPCVTDGAVRCANAVMGARDMCTSGAWEPSIPCAPNETCVMVGSTAMCMPLVGLCVGRADETVCDDQGTMLHCSSDGTAKLVDTCTHPMLCMAGIKSGMCAACIPGEHMCEGKNLLTCAADGTRSTTTDCMSEALCDETAGSCRPPSCKAEEVKCVGDTLKTCSRDLTGWDESVSQSCDPNMCDSVNKRCRACSPGKRQCSGDQLQICDSQGQQFTTTSCDFSRPHCVDAGQCVQCVSDGDCPTYQSCQSRQCKDREALRVEASGSTALRVTVGAGYSLRVTVNFKAADPYDVTADNSFCSRLHHDGVGPGGDPANVEMTKSSASCTIPAESSTRVITFRGSKGMSCSSSPLSGRNVTLRYEDGFDTSCDDAVVSITAAPG